MKTHGMAGTRTYRSWLSMIARCHRPNSDGYYRYGAKGIVVCDRWRYSFEAFLSDMGERPEGKQLDRINGDEGYYPGNVRWATPKENCRNRKTTVKELPFIEGETKRERHIRTSRLYHLKYPERDKKWREENRDRSLAKSREYYKNHREERAAYRKAYFEAHRDEIRERARKRRLERVDEIRARSKEYYLRNKDEINARARQRYWKRNSDRLALPA